MKILKNLTLALSLFASSLFYQGCTEAERREIPGYDVSVPDWQEEDAGVKPEDSGRNSIDAWVDTGRPDTSVVDIEVDAEDVSIYDCEDGEKEILRCGQFNGRGEQERTCVDGEWEYDVCVELDTCVLGHEKNFYHGPPETIKKGICNAGKEKCQDENGVARYVVMVRQVTPEPETCNGLDDDCDGIVDEDFPNLGEECDNLATGACYREGVVICSPNGSTICDTEVIEPEEEVCNGIDDDCDGETDEGILGVEVPFYNVPEENRNVGRCRDGLEACLNSFGVTDYVIVREEIGITRERCNRIDDNCNGETDEGYDVGEVCDNEGIGACFAEGTMQCTRDGLATECNAPEREPQEEVCGNDIDENCDGEVERDCDGILFTGIDQGWDIYLLMLGQDPVNLTQHAGNDYDAEWSPDKRQIVFHSNRDGDSLKVYVMDRDGRNVRRVSERSYSFPSWSPVNHREIAVAGIRIVDVITGDLLRELPGGTDPTWSPDGRYIVSHTGDGEQSSVIDSQGIEPSRPLFDGGYASFSSNGEYIAYDDAHQVYILQINRDVEPIGEPIAFGAEGREASWSPDGRRIVYESSGALQNRRLYIKEVFNERGELTPNSPVMQITEIPSFEPSWN